MSDSPKEEKKTVKIIDKATGAVSRGESRGKKANRAEPKLEDNSSMSDKPSSPLSVGDDRRLEAQRVKSGTDNPQVEPTAMPAQGAVKENGLPSSSVPKDSKGITRVFDIIQRFYVASGAPKKITEPALKKLEERFLSAVQCSELLDLAQREDASLTRTVNLAFAAFEIHSTPTVKDLLLKFTVDAGRESFDLALENVDTWLPLTGEELPPAKELFRRYAARVEQIASSKEMLAKEKKERQVKLRNLLFLSLIWQANQGWVKEDEILRFLRTDGIFTTSTHYPSQAIEALLKTAYTQSSADFSPLGWLSRQVENTRVSQSSELERLQRDVERLTIERTQALDEIEALRRERDMLLGKTHDLEEAFNLQKQDAQHASIHQEDDKHRLRSQVTKALKSELPRLEEALIALRREPPKLHIVSHYVEETLDHLKKVLRDTEGE
nr:hypothetical protein [uncultured Halomonas sp.]